MRRLNLTPVERVLLCIAEWHNEAVIMALDREAPCPDPADALECVARIWVDVATWIELGDADKAAAALANARAAMKRLGEKRTADERIMIALARRADAAALGEAVETTDADVIELAADAWIEYVATADEALAEAREATIVAGEQA